MQLCKGEKCKQKFLRMSEWVNRRLSGNEEPKNENNNDCCVRVTMVMVKLALCSLCAIIVFFRAIAIRALRTFSNSRFILIGFCFVEMRPKQTQTEQVSKQARDLK